MAIGHPPAPLTPAALSRSVSPYPHPSSLAPIPPSGIRHHNGGRSAQTPQIAACIPLGQHGHPCPLSAAASPISSIAPPSLSVRPCLFGASVFTNRHFCKHTLSMVPTILPHEAACPRSIPRPCVPILSPSPRHLLGRVHPSARRAPSVAKPAKFVLCLSSRPSSNSLPLAVLCPLQSVYREHRVNDMPPL